MTEEAKERIHYAAMTLLALGDKKACAELLWPWLIQNDQTDRIWNALEKYPYLAIMGHASASKTFTCAAWFLLDWWSMSHETALIITSDTIASMNRRVWSDIKTLMSKASVPMHGILIDSKRIIQHSQMDQKNAIAGVAAESDDAQSKIQGIHTKRVRVLIDEADNKLSQSIWSALSNLGSSGDMKVVALANPSDRLGEFGRHCEPKDGWSSVNPEIDDEWDSRLGWHVLRLDALKSPNIVAGKDIFPFLFTNVGLQSIREQKGENSPEWWSYVRAWYPPSGLVQSIFTNEIIEKSRKKIVWYSETTKIAACDPAFEGGDNCVVCIGEMGRLAENPRKTGIEVKKFIRIKRKNASVPITKDFTDQIVGLLENENIKPENFVIDCTGNALGLSDGIKYALQDNILSVNFGGPPTEMMITTEDTKKARDRYDRFVSELWYVGREWMNLGLLCIPNPPREVLIQLEGRLYELIVTSGKISVEKKDKMKARGLGSPDDTEAMLLLVHLARVRSKSGTIGLSEPGKKVDPLKRFRRVQSTFKINYGVPDREE